MGLVYHNGRFIPEEQIQKATEAEQALRLLRSFLDKNEPGLVRILVNTFRSQGNAITYKELREAILAGDISTEWLEEWMQDYARFVAKELQPAWERAIRAAVEELERKYPTYFFDHMAEGVRSWVETRAAEFVTNVSQTQIEGLRALIQRAIGMEDMAANELAKAIRPMVGLTAQASNVVMNYYETLRANGVSEKRALDKMIRLASRKHRERAYLIARTELATAYNRGAHEGTKQAQAAGLIGECVKVWCTADDERVCKTICYPLDNTEWPMDDDIMYDYTYKRSGVKTVRRINHSLDDPGAGKHPPAHPGCRCAVMYVEKKPPKFQNSQQGN